MSVYICMELSYYQPAQGIAYVHPPSMSLPINIAKSNHYPDLYNHFFTSSYTSHTLNVYNLLSLASASITIRLILGLLYDLVIYSFSLLCGFSLNAYTTVYPFSY